jgi:hypothetical protein
VFKQVSALQAGAAHRRGELLYATVTQPCGGQLRQLAPQQTNAEGVICGTRDARDTQEVRGDVQADDSLQQVGNPSVHRLQNPPKKQRTVWPWLLISLGGVVILVGVGVIAYFLGSSKSDRGPASSSDNSSADSPGISGADRIHARPTPRRQDARGAAIHRRCRAPCGDRICTGELRDMLGDALNRVSADASEVAVVVAEVDRA